MKRKVRRDRKNFLRIVQQAGADPLNDLKRENIIYCISISTDLEILEIDDFVMEKSVGSGASSDVYLLSRKKDGEKFAGKFVNPEIGTKEFTNEATILKSVSSKCASIVNLIGIITTPKCLVLEFFRNGNLYEALQEDSVNVATGKRTEYPFLCRLSYILDLCSAVNELHRANICHRDIAMRNLLLSDDKKHIVLTDFSMSRILNSAFKEQSTLSPLVPTKSPPETFRIKISELGLENCQRWYSLKSDIWGLGATMFEIIDKKELRDIKMPSRFPTERLPSKKDFNRVQDLWILILRCWNEKPEDRPHSWDVLESIGKLVANPLNVKNEYHGYIRSPITLNSNLDLKPSIPYTYSSEILFNNFSSISDIHKDWHSNPSGSLYLEGSSSCTLKEVIHTSIMPSMMRDFYRLAGSQSGSHELGMKKNIRMDQLINKQQQVRRKDNDNLSNKHFIKPSDVSRPKISASSQKIKPAHLQPLNSPIRRTISSSLKSVSELTAVDGWKSMRRVETTSSILSSSFRSEEPFSKKKVQYCSPLSVSSTTSVTDLRGCKNRIFFTSTVDEKPHSSGFQSKADPKSCSPKEQPSNPSIILYAL